MLTRSAPDVSSLAPNAPALPREVCRRVAVSCAATARGRLAFRGVLVGVLALSAAHSATFVGRSVDTYARVRP